MKIVQKIYFWIWGFCSKYDNKGEATVGYWQNKVRKCVCEIVSSYKGKLLEVGCGSGTLLSYIAQCNPALELCGVDSCDDRVKYAEKFLEKNCFHAIRISRADGRKLPFDNASYDSVVCVNVLCVLPSLSDVSIVVGELARVCKDDGRIVVEFRNGANMFLRFRYWLAKYYDSTVARQGLYVYSQADIISILDRFGFKVIKKRYLGFPWVVAIVLEGIKQK
jgi:ubiquinone/menaquinone biosynthesis C-methylase UbiE